MLPHLARRNVAWVDRRPTRRQQADERRLWPLQVEADFEIAVDRYLSKVLIPGFARIDPELFRPGTPQQIPGAFNVPGAERLAVMPFDALAQFENQRRAILAPRPLDGEIGDNCFEPVLRNMLIEHHEIVEHRHHRPLGDDRRLLVDRHAGRAVAMG